MTTALPAATDFTSASTQGAAKTAYANQRQFLADLLGTSGVVADARTALGLGSISTQAASAVAITGGAIDGTTLGTTTRASIKGTTLDASGDLTVATNVVSLSASAPATSLKLTSAGNFGIGVSPSKKLDVMVDSGGGTGGVYIARNNTVNLFANIATTVEAQIGTETSHPLTILTNNTRVARFSNSSLDGSSPNAANSVFQVWRDGGSLRSMNASGTVNVSGADLAEYRLTGEIRMPVAKGQVIGYQADGKVTDKWSLSVEQSRWQIKTTNPHVVGGDTWGTEDIVGKRPEEPAAHNLLYEGPNQPEPPMEMPALVLPTQPPEPVRQSDEDDATFKVRLAAWRDESARVDARIVEAQAAYATLLNMHVQLVASYQDALGIWEQEQQQFAARVEAAKHAFETVTLVAYQNDLAAWEARLEAQRQTVDRIAYNGEVPMIIGKDKTKKAGDRVVPIEGPDDTIDVKFVDPNDIEFRDYVRCCGTVTSVGEDGTCIVAVKVG